MAVKGKAVICRTESEWRMTLRSSDPEANRD
jgi:hypothetical protein